MQITKKIIVSAALALIVSIAVATATKAATVVTIEAADVDRLERLVYAEAGNQSLQAQKLVCATVINRCYSDEFPNSVEAVIQDKQGGCYQFSCVPNGMYANARPTDQVRQAVNEVLSEYASGTAAYPSDMLFFRSGYFFNWSTVEDYVNEDDMYFSRLR